MKSSHEKALHSKKGKKLDVAHDNDEYHLSKTTKRGIGHLRGVSHVKREGMSMSEAMTTGLKGKKHFS